MIGNWDDAIFVALGSNLGGEYGSSRAVLEHAVAGFGEIGLIVKAKSSLWASKAWPDASKPDYLNAVVALDTALSPAALLEALHGMEARFGRVRSAPNASRVLDLDLIAYGRRVQVGPPILPHPRAADRRFVMGPLVEIAPGWRHPVSGQTANALAAAATVGADAASLPLEGGGIERGGERDAGAK